jgi:hypothetical protein
MRWTAVVSAIRGPCVAARDGVECRSYVMSRLVLRRLDAWVDEMQLRCSHLAVGWASLAEHRASGRCHAPSVNMVSLATVVVALVDQFTGEDALQLVLFFWREDTFQSTTRHEGRQKQ